jgi:hypothetical protein
MGTILVRRRRPGGRGIGRTAGDQRLICCSVGCEDGFDTAGATPPDARVGAHADDDFGVAPETLAEGANPESECGVVADDGWVSTPLP